MAQNREMILANFQACTGVEDLGEAILHLEEAQWDLLTAVNRVMPADSQAMQQYGVADLSNPGPQDLHMPIGASIPDAPTAGSRSTPPSPPVANPEAAHFPAPYISSYLPTTSNPVRDDINMIDLAPSTSHGYRDTYVFKIKYQNMVLTIETPVTRTIEDLKNLIQLQTDVQASHQLLTGWNISNSSDFTPLKNLGLAKETTLLLSVLPNVVNDCQGKDIDRTSWTFTLNVQHEGKKSYHLKFPGSHTVLEVKNDIYSLTDIPARHQVWTGWPAGLKDDKTMLANAGLNFPEHHLSVHRVAPKTPPKSPVQPKRRVVLEPGESDASEEEFEDASESLTGDEDQELFMDDMPSNKLIPLIPADTDDEMAGAIHFREAFTNRYGAAHPEFYPGSLEDAIKDSCLKPAKDRKLLALYIHHDGSVLSNVFCTQLLGSESVHEFLSQHFVVWGWDITYESNKLMLLNTVARNLGNMAAMTIRSVQMDRLPILVIIMRTRSNTEIFRIVHGNVGASELLSSLFEAGEVFLAQRSSDLKDEEERAARELIKIEQDRAYQASLAVDRAKEESKKQQELLQEQERERLEREREEKEILREAFRLEIEQQLPPEPEEGSGDSIIKIRYRLPAGGSLERRFLASAQLKSLLDFLTVKGYPVENYKVITWPRRDLSSLDPQLSLAELKLCPMETVTIEER